MSIFSSLYKKQAWYKHSPPLTLENDNIKDPDREFLDFIANNEWDSDTTEKVRIAIDKAINTFKAN